jgi:hypothetical protein
MFRYQVERPDSRFRALMAAQLNAAGGETITYKAEEENEDTSEAHEGTDEHQTQDSESQPSQKAS